MISRFERFCFAITEIYKYWHKIAADEMKKYGLKGPYANYLITMKRFPEGITAAELTELSGRDKSDVSRAMSAMVEKGLVKKEGVNQNLYRAKLKLTKEGEKAAEHVSKIAGVAVDIAGEGLTDENRGVFYESLELIASNLQNISKAGLPK